MMVLGGADPPPPFPVYKVRYLNDLTWSPYSSLVSLFFPLFFSLHLSSNARLHLCPFSFFPPADECSVSGVGTSWFSIIKRRGCDGAVFLRLLLQWWQLELLCYRWMECVYHTNTSEWKINSPWLVHPVCLCACERGWVGVYEGWSSSILTWRRVVNKLYINQGHNTYEGLQTESRTQSVPSYKSSCFETQT